MPNLVDLIKQAAVEANAAGEPTGITFGTVVSATPLSVNLNQKVTLTEEFLMLTHNVMDYQVDMTVNHMTESAIGGSGEESFASHTHGYLGKKTFTVHNGLKAGDKVILLKQQGGQLYIILDKMGV